MPRDAPTRHTEREAKLTPPVGFRLEDLGAPRDAAGIEPRPTLHLVASYFDTTALTLARSGITLRHRTGEGPDRWTLKLPVDTTRRSLVRHEITIEGPRTPRPREFGSVLKVHVRGRRLVAVAEITTVRERVVVTDEEGRPLVEVAHDQVEATRGNRTLAAWDEVEVEALDPDRGAAAMKRTVRALRAMGCERAPAVPKLVKALGEAAAAPPDVVLPTLPRRPTTAEALQAALARSVDQIMDNDPRVRIGGDPEDLHHFRVAIRRLRSDLRTFRRFLDPDRAARLSGELRWMADETNELRDLDVLHDWLQTRGALLGEDDQPAVATLVAQCEDEQAPRRERLLHLLQSARYAALIQDLLDLLATPKELPKRDDAKARRRLVKQVEHRWEALAEKMAVLEAERTDLALHQARIAAKRCRAATEARALLAGSEVRRLARSLAELQDVLGAAHDAAVITAWLRGPAGEPVPFVAGELAMAIRTEGAEQEAHWPQVWARVRKHHRAI